MRARAVLALYRAWRVAREDSSGLALPTGRRILLPNEETRDFFHDRANHFPALEAAAETIGREMGARPSEMNHAIAERLRRAHGLAVIVGPLEGAMRRHDAAARTLHLSESLPRESRGFQMAFTLMLLEARDAVEAAMAGAEPSTPEAAQMMRIGLLNYAAAALLMPYAPYLARGARIAPRHRGAGRAVRRVASSRRRSGFPPCSAMARAACPSSSCGSIRRAMSASASRPPASPSRASAGPARAGWCMRPSPRRADPRAGGAAAGWRDLPDHRADGAGAGPAHWGEPPPVHVVAMGCDITRAPELVYAEGIDLEAAAVGIGLSCRLCDRADCRSRAFPPLEHRLVLDPAEEGTAPYRFEAAARAAPSPPAAEAPSTGKARLQASRRR